MKKRHAGFAVIAFAIVFGAAGFTGAAPAAETAAAAWATMDADDDGALSADEVSGTPWEAPFADMDGDGDSQVTKKEFQTFMQARQSAQGSNTAS